MLNVNEHLQFEVTCFWIWTQQQRDHAQSNWTKSTKSEEFVPKLHPLNGSCGQLISRFRAPNFRADSWSELPAPELFMTETSDSDGKRFIQTKTVRRSETAKSFNSDAKFLRFVWDTLQCHCHCHALQIRSSLGSFCHEVEQHMQCGKSWASLFFFMIQLMHNMPVGLMLYLGWFDHGLKHLKLHPNAPPEH